MSHMTHRQKTVIQIACAAVMLAPILQVQADTQSDEQPQSQPAAAVLLQVESLPNAYRLNESVISGGQPLGAAGFAALKRLGVRTVISVDGAKPDLALAKKHGLRYVHLPHGYDGISERRALELAKAVSDLPGPVYIHYHHGKHRSPAAAAVACIGAGLMTRDEGRELLELAGTSPDYRGLYAVVASTARQHGLDRVEVEFRETIDVPPLATAMVQIERTFDHLRQIERAEWNVLPSHPDLTPPHEALLLQEHFAELLRTDDVRGRPVAFRQLLEHSRSEAESLRRMLGETPSSPQAAATQRLSAALTAISNDCTNCHRRFRDRPVPSN
jgi:protein tyrosine phosphatase (PTP) superfamily phosphohydrolase (DUF442 family)